MKCGIEDVGLFQTVKLNLAVTHLVVDALQLIIQLQLLSLKFTVFLLIPLGRDGEIFKEIFKVCKISPTSSLNTTDVITHCSSSVSSC